MSTWFHAETVAHGFTGDKAWTLAKRIWWDVKFSEPLLRKGGIPA
jgi:hypothetical protein